MDERSVKIRVLPDRVIDQIAAGEVVERPASVVKELVENSLDAGARRITITLRAGGAERIQVADDGCGMDREDALMCLERHATSKIGDTTDLETIQSLGFRGEALPSIASVSRLVLKTRPHDVDEGVRVVVEGGTLRHAGPVGCPAGTVFDVRDLFFNVPARRKFLRSRATEYAHCFEAVVRQALIRPEVAFRLTHDGRVALTCDGTDRPGRARQILGRDANQMVELRFERDGIRVAGMASPLSVHRPSGKSLYLFVNGRYVRDAVVRRAIHEAYRDRIPRGRSPLVILDIRMDPRRVDVNVHPAKTEVRFRDPRDVQAVLTDGLRAALDGIGLRRTLEAPGKRRSRREEERAPPLPLGVSPSPPPLPALPDDDPLLQRVSQEAPPHAAAPATPASRCEKARPARPADRGTLSDGDAVPACAIPGTDVTAREAPRADEARRWRPIGAYGARWYLLEGEDELVVVDHRRGTALLRAQELRVRRRTRRLLVPFRERLTEREVDTLLQRSEELEALGLELMRLGPTELLVRTVPASLPELPLDGLLRRLVGAEDLAFVLAETSIGPDIPDDRSIRALLLSLDEIGASCTVRRIPTAELIR